jgi:hypothetical protein
MATDVTSTVATAMKPRKSRPHAVPAFQAMNWSASSSRPDFASTRPKAARSGVRRASPTRSPW